MSSKNRSKGGEQVCGCLDAGKVGGLDTGGDEGVAGVVDARREIGGGNGSGDAGIAPAVGKLGREGGGGEVPERFDLGAEEVSPEIWRAFEVGPGEGLRGVGDEGGGAGRDAAELVILTGGPGESGGVGGGDGIAICCDAGRTTLIPEQQGEAGDEGVPGQCEAQELAGLREGRSGDDVVEGLAVQEPCLSGRDQGGDGSAETKREALRQVAGEAAVAFGVVEAGIA